MNEFHIEIEIEETCPATLRSGDIPIVDAIEITCGDRPERGFIWALIMSLPFWGGLAYLVG